LLLKGAGVLRIEFWCTGFLEVIESPRLQGCGVPESGF